MNGSSRTARLRRLVWAVIFTASTLPAAACGPGGSVYVGVAAPGPWVGYPGGYYPGAWGYPGYRWEEEEEDGEAPDPLDWEAPWAQSSAPALPLDENSRPTR